MRVTHPRYPLQLQHPGAGWVLLSPTDAQRFSSLAAVGAIFRGQLLGLVLVEEIPSLSLTDYAEAVIGNLSLEDFQLEESLWVEVAGQRALQVRYSGRGPRGRLRYQSHLFLYEGRGYQVSIGGLADHFHPSAIETFISALSLSDARTQASVPPRAERGVAWTIQGARFQDVAAMIELQAPEGWEILGPPSLTRSLPGSFVGLRREGSPTQLTLSQVRCADGGSRSRCASELRERRYQAWDLPQEEREFLEFSLEFIGAPLQLRSILIEEEGLLFLLVEGLYLREERGIQLSFQRPLTLAARSDELTLHAAQQEALGELATLLGAFRRLPEEDALRLLRGRRRRPHPQSWVGAESSLVDGSYQHFRVPLRWVLPQDGFWELLTGDALRARDPRALLQLWERGEDLRALFRSEASYGLTLNAAHGQERDRLQRELQWTALSPRSFEHGGVSGLLSEGAALAQGVHSWFQLITLSSRGQMLQIQLWSPAAGSRSRARAPAVAEQHRRQILAPLQLSVPPSPEVLLGDRWRDLRFAFQLQLGEGGVERRLLPPGRKVGAALRWHISGGDHCELLALSTPLGANPDAHTTPLLLASLGEEGSALTGAAGPAQYRGYQLTHYQNERARALLIERGSLRYGLYCSGGTAPLQLLETRQLQLLKLPR